MSDRFFGAILAIASLVVILRPDATPVWPAMGQIAEIAIAVVVMVLYAQLLPEIGFVIAITWQNLLLAVMGCFLDTIFGALPELGPLTGVAILIPLAFSLGLEPLASLILRTSVHHGAMYGGRVNSILLNIPGDEPAMMTSLDGYPMATKGMAGEALALALSGIASFIGTFLATWGLILLASRLAKFALRFGSAEYFALFTLAFATLGDAT